MRTFVKLCGLRDPAAVAEVPTGGAAGFVVGVPRSPRNLSVDAARVLLEALPSEVEGWAVTVDPTAEFVRQLFDEVGVDRIQVHGTVPEGLDFLERHHLVPSLPLPPAGAAGPIPPLPAVEEFPRLHLDTAGQDSSGGSGARSNWEVAAELVDRNPGRKFLLAGGLTPENVGDAIASVRPWGVDVSSGIETEPGVKDVAKMRAFVAAVGRHERGDG
jgi:phosphoribosylanthranilate isomerase